MSDRSNSNLSPSVTFIGGLIDDPMLTNLVLSEYVATTELVAAETTLISITSLGLRVCTSFVFTVTSTICKSPVMLLLCDTNE